MDGSREIVVSKFQKWIFEGEELHTEYGILTKEDLEQEIIEKFKETFYVLKTSFIDEYKQIKRDRQIITLKDIGSIITSTGINRDSKVIDAGTGSGALAIYLAKICNHVTTIDILEDNTNLARNNATNLNIDNITFLTTDITKYEGEEHDVFILDIPNPKLGINTAKKILKRGGYFVVYAPQIEQIINVVRAIPKEFIVEEIKAITENKWQIDLSRSKPISGEIGHTAFLAVFRKL